MSGRGVGSGQHFGPRIIDTHTSAFNTTPQHNMMTHLSPINSQIKVQFLILFECTQ